MPTKSAQIEMVANQMLKGVNNTTLPDVSIRENFRKEHENEISHIVHNLPRCSAAVGAVLTKASMKYGRESIENFCLALKNQNFNGTDDPTYLLWKFLQEHRGKNTKVVYQKTLCAVRAFLKKRKIK